MTLVYEREMTITHKDFLRLLPKAISGLTFQRNGNQIDIVDADRSIRIKLSKESSRKIASLNLPVTKVRIELRDFSQSQSVIFISRFDLAYQKGGG